jgi:hypothetical protein
MTIVASSSLPVVCRPTSSRCASAARASGSTVHSMRSRPSLTQPSTVDARAWNCLSVRSKWLPVGYDTVTCMTFQ